ncbi:hypothetical protein FRX31_031759 [Thalictrum thalictroides]|uniref:Uncharacterized protein n=1 Tax=Thalictrum thalictroides TaxID=46969 RepID=A0A7J6V3E8_THATH|nr:hypothetical protein FRX31_031759 [Thalictrum thalictroides]
MLLQMILQVVNGAKTSNVGTRPGNGAKIVNGTKTSNVGARSGNIARTGTNGTTIHPIGPPRPQSKPPTKPK